MRSARPLAADLLEAVLAEYDLRAGRNLRGGPSATPAELSAPHGAYVVGFVEGEAACGGGIKRWDPRTAELKRLYVAPRFRGCGVARTLLVALEDARLGSGTR